MMAHDVQHERGHSGSVAPGPATLADFASDTLTVEQVGQILGIGRSASYQAIQRGDIPGVIRIGRRVLVSRHALAAMLGVNDSTIEGAAVNTGARTHKGRAANATPVET